MNDNNSTEREEFLSLAEAREIFGELESIILDLSRIYVSMGNICQKKGFSQEAIACYQRFITLNPNSPLTKEVAEKLNTIIINSQGDATSPVGEEGYDNIEYIAPDFHTMTLAELYIRQGHLEIAADILEKILKRDAGNQKAAEKLHDVKAMLSDRTGNGYSRGRHSEVIKELTGWLKNIEKIRGYKA